MWLYASVSCSTMEAKTSTCVRICFTDNAASSIAAAVSCAAVQWLTKFVTTSRISAHPPGSRKTGGAAPQRPAHKHIVFACAALAALRIMGIKNLTGLDFASRCGSTFPKILIVDLNTAPEPRGMDPTLPRSREVAAG
jgi:hypothetical protein